MYKAVKYAFTGAAALVGAVAVAEAGMEGFTEFSPDQYGPFYATSVKRVTPETDNFVQRALLGNTENYRVVTGILPSGEGIKERSFIMSAEQVTKLGFDENKCGCGIEPDLIVDNAAIVTTKGQYLEPLANVFPRAIGEITTRPLSAEEKASINAQIGEAVRSGKMGSGMVIKMFRDVAPAPKP